MKFGIKYTAGLFCFIFLIIFFIIFFEPVWFVYYRNKLISDNVEEAGTASELLARKKFKAIPYLRKWMLSREKELAVRSISVLDKMDDDVWKEGLPELEIILSNDYSEKTNAAARLVLDKKYILNDIQVYSWDYKFLEQEYKWKKFANNHKAKVNICRFIFESEYDENLQLFAVDTIAHMLGKSAFRFYKKLVCNAVGSKNKKRLLNHVIDKFGVIRNSEAIPVLKKLYSINKGDKSKIIKSLGLIGGDDAAIVINEIYNSINHNTNPELKCPLMRAIGRIGSSKSAEILIKNLERIGQDGTDLSELAKEALIASMFIADNRIDGILKKKLANIMIGETSTWLIFTIYWRTGVIPKPFSKEDIKSVDIGGLLGMLADARWGDKKSLHSIVNLGLNSRLIYTYPYINYLNKLVKRVPLELQEIIVGRVESRNSNKQSAKDWIKNNYRRITWDKKRNIYILKQ